jgi:hypothetical protein
MFKCCRKLAGWTLIGAAAFGILGFVTFGTSFGSYMRSSLGLMKNSVKESIPIEFEIQRARDLLEDLIPETRANLRLVAQEEVEVLNLDKEIAAQRDAVGEQRKKVQKLRETLATQEVSYRIGDRRYERTELVDSLSTQFDRLTTAERFLAGKEELLKNRKSSLSAAMKKLEQTRIAKVELEAQIEALEEQFRLMKLAASGKDFRLDDSKLAEVQKVLKELKDRLDVTQRVMASEAKFIDDLPLESDQDEGTVFERVDSYFTRKPEAAPAAAVAKSAEY